MNKIKILHLFETYLPNTENWIYNLLSKINNANHHIGAFTILENSFKSNQFKFALSAIDPLRKKRKESSNQGLRRFFERIHIGVHHLIYGTTVYKMGNYIEGNNIDIIHVHFANIGWDFLPLKVKTGLPMLISLYGWDYEKLPFTKPIFKDRYQQLFKIADGFICEGNHGAKILEKKGCPKHKLFIVPLGVKVSEINFVKREKKSNSLRLVQLASFTEKKGQRYAIEALATVIESCPNIELTFIGNERQNGLLDELIKLVKILKLEKQVKFLPSINYADLQQYISQYDVMIHPSCYAADMDCEGGAPIVLLDAQASGMPVIATNHCDIPSEVIHQKTGLLCEEKNSAALGKLIKQFYEMADLEYQSFAQNARNHIEQYFDVEKTSKKLEQIYQKFIS